MIYREWWFLAVIVKNDVRLRFTWSLTCYFLVLKSRWGTSCSAALFSDTVRILQLGTARSLTLFLDISENRPYSWPVLGDRGFHRVSVEDTIVWSFGSLLYSLDVLSDTTSWGRLRGLDSLRRGAQVHLMCLTPQTVSIECTTGQGCLFYTGWNRDVYNIHNESNMCFTWQWMSTECAKGKGYF